MAKVLVAAVFLAACGGAAVSTVPATRAADLAGAPLADLAGASDRDAASADGGPGADGGPADAATGDLAGVTSCEWGGAPGTCQTLTACAALGDHSSEAGSCPGPATIQCCIVTPAVADNPPTPSGWKPMQEAQVTTAMTNWAVAILHDPVTYPMFATTTMQFDALLVLARVEWHPPDFQNSIVHRGVTLYVPSS